MICDVLPRLVLPISDPAAADLAAALARLSGPAVLVPVAVTLPSHLERAAPEEFLSALNAARANARPLGLEAPAPAAAAEALLAVGRVDGLLSLEPAPAEALRVRGGVRCLGGERELSAEELDAAAGLVRDLLGRAPSLVVLPGRGQSHLHQRLRALGHASEAPPELRASTRLRPDAWICADPRDAEWILGLLGSGPEVALGLCGRRAFVGGDPTQLRPSLELAAELLTRLARARGELAEARDPQAAQATPAPQVNVSARAARPASDRCPYCHRALGVSGDGRRGRPGPPILCARCGTGHHRDCLREHGRCTVLGCPSDHFTRLGARIGVAALGEEDAREWPFETLPGDAGTGPSWLRVEAPLEDLGRGPHGLRVELPALEVQRGGLVEGDVVFSSARTQRLRGAVVELRATLSTRRVGERPTPWKTQPMLARRACFLGEPPGGALGRLGANVFNLLGGAAGVELGAGRHRYPFSFELPPEHPRSLTSRQGDHEEQVKTQLIVLLGGHRAELELQVR